MKTELWQVFCRQRKKKAGISRKIGKNRGADFDKNLNLDGLFDMEERSRAENRENQIGKYKDSLSESRNDSQLLMRKDPPEMTQQLIYERSRYLINN